MTLLWQNDLRRLFQSTRTQRILWSLMLLLALFAAGNAVLFMFTDWVGGRSFKARFHNPFWLGALHTIAGAGAVLIGPFQFVERWRSQWPTLHRHLGQTYITLVLTSAVAGLWFATRPVGGAIVGVGFGVLALAWIFSGVIAWRHALARRRRQHRAWMQFNYVMTFASATLRVELGLLMLVGLNFSTAFAIVAWSSWVGNIAVLAIAKRLLRDAPITTNVASSIRQG